MKRIGSGIAIMIIFGLIGLTQFSENVRTVQVLGLFASGMAVGVALAGFLLALRSKQKGQP